MALLDSANKGIICAVWNPLEWSAGSSELVSVPSVWNWHESTALWKWERLQSRFDRSFHYWKPHWVTLTSHQTLVSCCRWELTAVKQLLANITKQHFLHITLCWISILVCHSTFDHLPFTTYEQSKVKDSSVQTRIGEKPYLRQCECSSHLLQHGRQQSWIYRDKHSWGSEVVLIILQ